MPQSVSDQELSRQNDIERKQPRHTDDIERFPGRSTASHGTPLPPSVEKAYYRKCIELKRRINDVEDANDALRVRRARINRSILKMRLERAFLLEQLQKRMEYNSDGSERSESPPPTPQEKPLRSKRAHRKTTPSTAGGAGGTSAHLSPPENPGQSSVTRAHSSNHTTPDARAAGTLEFPSSATQAGAAPQAANGSIITSRNGSRSNRGDFALSSSSTSTYKQSQQYGNHDERRISSTSNSAVLLPTSTSAASHENGTSRIGGAEYTLPSFEDSGRESAAEKDIRRSSGGHRSHYHHHHHLHHQHPHPHPHSYSHSHSHSHREHREHREHHQHHRHQLHQAQDRDHERRHHHHHHHHHHQHQDARLNSVADANRERRRVSTDTEMGEAPNAGDDGHDSGGREVDDAGFMAVNR